MSRPLRTGLRDIEQSLPLQLLRARESAMAHFRPMLRQHELTEQQWRVIRVLAAAPQLDAGELAARTLLLAPSLSRILQHLEERKLVVRQQDASDQRRSVLSLSDAGRAKYAEVSPDSETLYGQIEDRFGRDNLALLHRLLAELNTALGSTAARAAVEGEHSHAE